MGLRQHSPRSGYGFRARLGAAVAVAVTVTTGCVPVLPPPTNPPTAPPPVAPIPAAASWLTALNYYRAMAGLAPVTDNPRAAGPLALHTRWMALNLTVDHWERPGTPGYTPSGFEAGQHAVLAHRAISPDRANSGRDWVEVWMRAPFHALSLLNPALRSAAFAVSSTADGRNDFAGIDTASGLGPRPTLARPVVWPAAGQTVPLVEAVLAERPDPYAPCPGYDPPAGLPILIQFPQTPAGVRSTVTVDGRPVEHCRYDETSPRVDSTMYLPLAYQHAMVLMPRAPLPGGAKV